RVLSKTSADANARAVEPRARRARARVAVTLHDSMTAAADIRWLAVEAPATEEARDALRDGGAAPPLRLTSEERLARAKKLADVGRIDEALSEIDLAATQGATAPAVLHAKGWAYYTARADYRKAAALLEQAAAQNPKEKVRDAFYAARALA